MTDEDPTPRISTGTRREATYEQKGEDAERWEAIRAQARELGVG